jgi:hypothetical protein
MTTATGRRRRTAAVAACALAAATLLAGCGTDLVQRNTFTEQPRAAIADDSVGDALAALDAVRNEANAGRNPELIQTVEADPLLTITTAVYALDATTDPEGTTVPQPVTHANPTAFIPRFTDYPQWFVVAAPWRQGEPTRLEVLTRDSSSAPWTSLIAPELLRDVDFPTLALDEGGYVLSADEDFLATLATPVDGLADAYALGLTSGSSDDPVVTALVADPWSVSRRNADGAAATTVGAAATVAGTYTAGTTLPQALTAQDGGALVFFTIDESLVYTVKPGYFLELDDTTAKIVETDQVTGTLTETASGQLVVYVPPAGGTARIVGARWDRTGLTAAEPASATPTSTPTS